MRPVPPIRLLAALLLAGSCLAVTASGRPSDDAEVVLESVRAAYGTLTELEERGSISISHRDGEPAPRSLAFAAGVGEDGFWLSIGEGTTDEILLWRARDGTAWSLRDGVTRPVDSVAVAARSLLPAGGVALAQATLLATGDLAFSIEGLRLEKAGDCGAEACRVLAGTSDDGARFRWWLGPDDRIRESRIESVDGWTITVSREPAATTAVALAGSLGVPGGDPPHDDREPSEDTVLDRGIAETVTVRLASAVVRVGTPGGKPIPSLGPDDFKVSVAGQRVRVVAADFVDGSDAPHDPGLPSGLELGDLPEVSAFDSKLVVLFFQADLDPSRIKGQFKMRPHVRTLLDSLHSNDWAAVASFDSQLRIHHDFSRDTESLESAARRAIFRGPGPELEPPAPSRPSLLVGADPEDFAAAANPARAIKLIADAMADWPGEKMLVFIGYGLGSRVDDQEEMSRSLRSADISVWILDITEALYHTMEDGLKQLARYTGGTYEKTLYFPAVATQRLAATLSARYILYFERPELPEGRYRVSVRLDDVPKSWIFVLTKFVP